MRKSSPRPENTELGADAPSSLTGFGFELGEAAWLERVRRATQQGPLGSIGPYELIDELSRGGQGVVFRARQPGTRRIIALKRMLAGSFSTQAMRRRFEREVELAATLQHPNLVTVFGMEQVDGLPLLAMEWIDGVPIAEWAAGGSDPERGGSPVRRGLREILETFLRVCEAVQHAHGRGVLHRDLKPSNILVDRAGEPRVLDFGLAKAFAEAGDARSEAPLTSGFVGTPAYASPEQLDGREAALDIQSDVYSLGVVLYELLTGQLPYDASHGLAALFQAIERARPARPSALAPGLSSELDAIALKALEREPARRYASVNALADDLRRHLDGRPIAAHPQSALYVLRKWTGRNRLATGLLAAVALLFVSFAAVSAWQAARLREQRDEAVDARQAADDYAAELELARDGYRDEALKAGAVLDFLLDDLLEGSDPGSAHADLSVSNLLDLASKRAGERFAGRPQIEARLRQVLGRTLRSLGRLPAAEAEFRRAIDLRQDDPESDAEARGVALADLGDCLARAGSLDEAEATLENARELLAARPGAGPCATAGVRASLGCLRSRRGQYAEAELELREALACLEEDTADGQVLRAGALCALSDLVAHRGDPARAVALAEEALALFRLARGPRHPEVALGLARLAHAHARLGCEIEAESEACEALEIVSACYGADHVLVGEAHAELGRLYYFLGRPQQSRAELLEGLRILRASPSASPFSLADTLMQFDRLADDENDLAESERYLREALELMRAPGFGSVRNLRIAEFDLAQVCWLTRKYAEAEELVRALLERPDEQWVTDPLDRFHGLIVLGSCRRNRGDLDEAERWLVEADGERERRGAAYLPDMADQWQFLAKARLEAGDAIAAEALYQRVIAALRPEAERSPLELSQALLRLGQARLVRGDAAAAEPDLRDALELAREHGLEQDGWLGRTEATLGRALERQGRAEEAESLLLEGYRRVGETLGEGSSTTQRIAGWIADCYEGRGRAEEARVWRARSAPAPQR